jgi:hypothetical protein
MKGSRPTSAYWQVYSINEYFFGTELITKPISQQKCQMPEVSPSVADKDPGRHGAASLARCIELAQYFRLDELTRQRWLRIASLWLGQRISIPLRWRSPATVHDQGDREARR